MKTNVGVVVGMLCACGSAVETHEAVTGTLPSYLLGTYSRGDRVENGVTLAGESIRFGPGNHYAYRGAGQYDLTVTEHTVSFATGPLTGRQLALGSMSPNCRTVQLEAQTLFRADEARDCPSANRMALTDGACELVGRWSKTVRSGTLEDLIEVALQVEVQADHFFVSTESVTRCVGGSCRTDQDWPKVGTWSSDERGLVGPDVVGFAHARVPGCELPHVDGIALLPAAGQPVMGPMTRVDPPAPHDYGRCEADQQCTGACSMVGTCTSPCKYAVECPSPKAGIAVCRSGACMASCAAGNACPTGLGCHDGLCL